MADQDLVFKIAAVDEYKQQLNDAIGLVDKLSATEREALKSTTDKAEADQKAAGIIVDRIKAIHEADNSTADLSKSEQAATDSTRQQTEAAKGLAEQTVNVGQQNRSAVGTFTELNSAIQLGQFALGKFKEAWDFAKEGAAIERIGAQFNQVAGDFGVNGDQLVAAMDRAAKGTIDDEELMQTATRALTQGVITNAQDLTKFVEIARASAVRFGGDTTQALQSILYATEVGAQRQLKATIGVVDFSRAYDELAARLGKRKQDLTDEEQLQARVNAVLAKGDDLIKKVGTSSDDTATKLQRLETRLKDFSDQVKVGAVDLLSEAIDHSTEFNIVLGQNVTETDRYTNALKLQSQGYQYMFNNQLGAVTIMKEQARAEIDTKQTTDNLGQGITNLASTQDRLQTIIMNSTARLNPYNLALNEWNSSQTLVDRGARNLADTQDLLQNKIMSSSSALEAYNAAVKAQGAILADQFSLAMTYTKSEESRAALEEKLAALNDKIASQGIAHTTIVANQKMTEDQRALALQKLTVAQEDVLQIQRKANETDAEYALRVSEAKSKVDTLTKSLGEHTAVVGGATKAQLEQKQALEDQIAAFDKASEIQRATDIFNAVATAIKSGSLSAEQGADRLEALNKVSHIYSQTALDEAKNQLALLAAFTDPKSEAWYSLLVKSQGALDGVSQATQNVTNKDLPALQTASTDMTRTAQKGVEDLQTQVATSGAQMHTASNVALERIRDVEVGISQSASAAAAVAEDRVYKLGDAAREISDHEYVIKFRIETEGSMPSASSGSGGRGRQHGGAIQDEGWYFLHPNEYVLSAAMRAGQQAIPPQALPAQRGGGTTINNNNFYDGQSTRLWFEKQRMDSIQSVLEAM